MANYAVYVTNLSYWHRLHSATTRTKHILDTPELDPEFKSLLKLLPETDQLRIQRFAYFHDALRGLVGAMLIRRVLALIAGDTTRIQDICIGRTQENKPYWDSAAESRLTESQKARLSQVSFNLSHHNSWVMLAVSITGTIGCDVASVGIPGRPLPIDDYLELMSSVMGSKESEYIRDSSITPQSRLTRHVVNWSLKEAFVKLLGEGLSFEPHNIEFIPEISCLDTPETKSQDVDSQHNTLLEMAHDLAPRKMSSHTMSKFAVAPLPETAKSSVPILSSMVSLFLSAVQARQPPAGPTSHLQPNEWNAVVNRSYTTDTYIGHHYMLVPQNSGISQGEAEWEVWQCYMSPAVARVPPVMRACEAVTVDDADQVEAEKRSPHPIEKFKDEPTAIAVIRSLKHRILAPEEERNTTRILDKADQDIDLESVTRALLQNPIHLNLSGVLPPFAHLIHPLALMEVSASIEP